MSTAYLFLGFFYGAASLFAQLCILRETAVVFSGKELALLLAVGIWMGTTGIGSYFASRLLSPAHSPVSRETLTGYFFRFGTIFAVLLPVELLLLRLTRHFLLPPGEFLNPLTVLFFLSLLLAPVGIINGLLFSFGASLRFPDKSAGGYFYASESLGAALIGMFYSFFFLGRIQPAWGVVISGFLLLAINSLFRHIFFTPVPFLKKQKENILGMTFLFLLAPAVIPSSYLLYPNYHLLRERDTRLSRLALTEIAGQKTLFINGAVTDSFPDPRCYEEIVHWAFLAHPATRDQRVLLVSPFPLDAFREIQKYHPQRIDYLELNPEKINFIRPYLTAEELKLLHSSGVDIRIADLRYWLKHSAPAYDIIILNLSPPENLAENRFFSKEFYQEIKKHLLPGGIVGITFPAAENYLSGGMRSSLESLFFTLRSSFPYCQPIPGDKLIILASAEDFSFSAALLEERYRERRLYNRVVTPEYISWKLRDKRSEEYRKLIPDYPSTGKENLLNLDFFPRLSFRYWRIEGEIFGSPLNLLGGGLFLIFLIFLFNNYRCLSRPERNWGLIFFGLGFGSFLGESILLLSYQTLEGYLYIWLGNFFGMFMFGLGIGSLSSAGLGRFLKDIRRIKNLLVLSVSLLALLFLGLRAGLSFLIRISPGGLNLLFLLLFFLLGFFTGFPFPLGILLVEHSSAKALNRPGFLYASDLWGATTAAILGNIWLIPAWGFSRTTVLLFFLFLFLALGTAFAFQPGKD